VTRQVVILVGVQISLVIPMCMVEKIKGLHDTCQGSSSSIGHSSGHSFKTPLVSPGTLHYLSSLGDVDGGVSPMLAFNFNPSAFDDIDVNPPSNYNGYVPLC